MKILAKKGLTSCLVEIFIQNKAVTTGAGLTGLVYDSAGLTAYYHRNTASGSTAITLATGTVGTWGSGMFKEVDSTNMPGVYQLGIPDAALASGADSVVVYLQGATNMLPIVLEIQLTGFDLQDATGTGLTALAGASAVTASAIRTALGLASANLDTQLDALPTASEVRVEMDANSTKLANLDATVTSRATPAQVLTQVQTANTTAVAESYAANGQAATPNQLLYMIYSLLANKAIVSTTLTAKKLDGSTSAMTFTLDSATAPTSVARAS